MKFEFDLKLPFVRRRTYDAVVNERDQYKQLVEMAIVGKRPTDEELGDLIAEDPGTPAGLRKMATAAAFKKAGRQA